ncbi:2Fe-2S iron-sulfur cluster-binding protein [Isoalcanivorax beigongshangi]|uniref:2Fe-2S iron-sulfur cluster-binding protein n=1 Tax=Isoalcanivorax beigongshangi TaxID=3238810 RepID=A0ABV4AH20_9GAMM
MDTEFCRIHVRNRDQVLLIRRGDKLLQGMEQCGQQLIRVGCRKGGCGLCRIRILSGEVACEKMSRCHVSAEDRALGYALACRVIPQTDLVIESDHCRLFQNTPTE